MSAGATGAEVHEGMPAPAFDAETCDGRRVRLGDFKGRRSVLLVFLRGFA